LFEKIGQMLDAVGGKWETWVVVTEDDKDIVEVELALAFGEFVDHLDSFALSTTSIWVLPDSFTQKTCDTEGTGRVANMCSS